jgi:hypothetical protein
LTLALVLGRAPTTISAGPLPGVTTETLFRIGLTLPIRHVALLLLAPIVMISGDHENASSEWRGCNDCQSVSFDTENVKLTSAIRDK